MYPQKYSTIDDIKMYVFSAIQKMSRASGSRHFLIEDKRVIVEMVRNCLSTHRQIAKALVTSSDSEERWLSRFATWGAAYNRGDLDVSKAVAVRSSKNITQVGNHTLKTLIEYELRSGMSVDSLISMVKSITDQFKAEIVNEAKREVEQMLATKGLSLSDLK